MSDQDQATSNANTNTTEAWEMTLSVVAAMEQTLAKATEEHQAAVAAGKGNPFAPGVAAAWHLREALEDALKEFRPDVHNIGRANGRPLAKATN